MYATMDKSNLNPIQKAFKTYNFKEDTAEKSAK